MAQTGREGTARTRGGRPRLTAGTARVLADTLLHDASSGLPRVEFLKLALETLLRTSQAGTGELWLREGDRFVVATMAPGDPGVFRLETLTREQLSRLARSRTEPGRPARPAPAAQILLGECESGSRRGADAGAAGAKTRGVRAQWSPDSTHPSFAMIPIVVGGQRIGLLVLADDAPGLFNATVIGWYQRLAQILGNALVSQRAQAALHERVKELTCLYGITQISEQPETTTELVLQQVVTLLPPAWQYPEITGARIVLDGKSFTTEGFTAGRHSQIAAILVNQAPRGFVEVSYAVDKPEIEEGPFLAEERNLIDAIATQLALIVERREAAEERARLQEQLRHADRLATIGQLAAGVAHELNEPLGNILGFAQLAAKAASLPGAIAADLDKIVAAALHAREIVKKLMLFARQTPPMKTDVDLNQVVVQSLYFLEARCAKQGIELQRELAADLPAITADPSQLQQVLVNLVVNAIQATPQGGRLTIHTGSAEGVVVLVVADTGTGMTEDVKRQIFIPFYTTKDVDQGTGLGLSVVHGIVTAHGGTIRVSSEVGRGTSFEIRLPVDRGKVRQGSRDEKAH